MPWWIWLFSAVVLASWIVTGFYLVAFERAMKTVSN